MAIAISASVVITSAVAVRVARSVALEKALLDLPNERSSAADAAVLSLEFRVLGFESGGVSAAEMLATRYSLPATRYPLLATALLTLWIVGVLNIHNFMDGIDGIAGIQAVMRCERRTAEGSAEPSGDAARR